MNHLTLYAYEEDGELFVWRCPDPDCGSTGPAWSTCVAHEPPLSMPEHPGFERKPVRVPGVGEEPRYTLEDLYSGLLTEGALRGGAESLHELRAVSFQLAPEILEGRAERIVKAALDHFTQLPAGVGADLFPRSSSDARAVRENPGVSADSDREFDEATQELAVELIDARREADGADARLCLLGVEAIAALREFDDHGDYEAPIGVLRRFIESAGSDGNQQPQGGRQEDVLGAVEEVGAALESGKEQVDNPGGSVQCGRVALAQLPPDWIPTLEHHASINERNVAEWERLGLSDDREAHAHVRASRAHAATLRSIAKFLTQQQSSGGQEGGVTKRVLDRAEELIAEGKLADEREGEVEEGADRRG